ncbi:MotA/TolQ/ExbB proton channel family protein [bacterium]|nr:MotA/TolQ/ExbB proton channel family protein [bacterium]
MNSESTTLYLMLSHGGWIMIPLGLCSLIALAVIVERILWGPRQKTILPLDLASEIESLIAQEKFDIAEAILRKTPSAYSRLVLPLLSSRNLSRAELSNLVETLGKQEGRVMSKHLGVLSTISAVAPLLGLLGTVVGMISMFASLGNQAGVDPQLVSRGISEALIATASGLTIAIPSLLFFRYFSSRTKHCIHALEEAVFRIFHQVAQR